MVTSDAWVLNPVTGYELELVSTPYQCLRPKELTFGEEELATLDMEIEKMKQKGAICIADNYIPEGVVFKPTKLAKQSRPEKEIFFPSFPHNSSVSA